MIRTTRAQMIIDGQRATARAAQDIRAARLQLCPSRLNKFAVVGACTRFCLKCEHLYSSMVVLLPILPHAVTARLPLAVQEIEGPCGPKAVFGVTVIGGNFFWNYRRILPANSPFTGEFAFLELP